MNKFSTDNLIRIITEKLHVVIIAGVMVGLVAFIVSNFLTPEYKTSVDLLVIQKQSADKVDAFGAAKSAEYLSGILEKAVYSSTFYNDIIDEVDGISAADFGDNETEIEKGWEKQVSAKSGGSSGIININVFYEDKEISANIAKAISNKLINDGQEFHGGGDQVEIKIINGPITKPKPAKPNIWVNALLGVMIGTFSAIVIIVLSTNKETILEEQIIKNQEQVETVFNRQPANFV